MPKSVEAFLSQIRADDALKGKVKALENDEALIALAKEHGHDLDRSAVTAYLREHGEIEDAELDNVAGGANVKQDDFGHPNDLDPYKKFLRGILSHIR